MDKNPLRVLDSKDPQDIEAVKNITDAHYQCADKLKEHFRDIEKEIIFPSLWAKK